MRIFAGTLLVVIALALMPSGARAQAPSGVAAPAAQPEAAPAPRAFDDPQAPAGWKRYEIQIKAGRVLSVFLPSPPEVSTNRVRAGAAGVGTNHMYIAHTRTDLYVISYLTGLSPAVTDDPQARAAIYESFWGEFASGMKAGLERRGIKAEPVAPPARKIKVGDLEVHEQDFVLGQMHGTYRVVTSGGYGYAVASGSFAGPVGADHKSFLKSLSLRAQP